MAIYYIDTVSFDLATAVWLQSTLISKAPDGFYSFGGDYRQQSGGLLGATIPCLLCPDCVPGTEVTIGTQEWTVCNLDVTTYSNLDPIPEVTDPTQWAALTTGAWCYYDNNPANGATYGKLYNWYAVNDPRGLAPVGYHVPYDTEWDILIAELGGAAVAGGKMKETGFCHWEEPNTNATNESGFTALPGGNRSPNFDVKTLISNFWCVQTGIYSWYFNLNYTTGNLNKPSGVKTHGFSVRLIKDNNT